MRYKRLTFIGLPNHRVGKSGSVWSRINKRGRIVAWYRLHPHVLNKGVKSKKEYYRIGLSHGKVKRMFMVHRLVLEAFVGPCPEGMEACHWDNNGLNCKLSNLRWDTPVNNQRDRIRHGTDNQGENPRLGEECGWAVLTEKKVLRIRRLYKKGWGGYKRLGKRFRVDWSTIRDVVKRRHWNHI